MTAPKQPCTDFRPDHNGECLNCDEPASEHAGLSDAVVDAFLTAAQEPDPERVDRIRKLYEKKKAEQD